MRITATFFTYGLLGSIIWCCVVGINRGQTRQWQHVRTLPIEAKRVWPLATGGWLALRADGVLQLYDGQGQASNYFWSDRLLGVPDAVDASQPLTIVLFFESFQQVIWLDRTLSVLAVLSFAEAGLTQVRAVAAAPDRRLWCYDTQLRQLLLLDVDGQIDMRSAPFDLLSEMVPQQVKWLQRHAAHLFFWAPPQLWMFDDFGQLMKQYTVESACEALFILPPWFVCQKAEVLSWQRLDHPLSQRIMELPKAANEVYQLVWNGADLYLLTEEGLELWYFE